jgi:hypothetical protein
LYFSNERSDYKLKIFNDNINEILKLLEEQLPAIGKIVNCKYSSGNLDQCFDDLYNLFYLIVSDGSQLTELAIKQSCCENRYDLPKLESIPCFKANIEIDYCDSKTNYHCIINNVSEYINILFYVFVSNNPIVSICQNCTQLFIPKTKKLTLYCDRVIANNSTCKRIGAKHKHNSNVELDPVLKKYQMEKHRIEMYCLRGKQDKYDFFDELFNWLDKFEPKLQAYKKGEYDGTKLIEEIEINKPNYQAYSKGKDFANEEGY